MMIGANKDGWWDEVKLMHQSEDLLDFLEAWDIDDEFQFIGHFDQSVAHNKKNAHALVGGVRWGSGHHTTPPHHHTTLHTRARRLPRMSACLGGGNKLYYAIVLCYLTALVIPKQKCILSLVKDVVTGKVVRNGLMVLVPALLKKTCC